jgi:hypothetical protein
MFPLDKSISAYSDSDIRFSVQCDRFTGLLREIADAPPEILDCLAKLPKVVEDFSSPKVDSFTARTGDVVVRFEPSDSLVKFVAALRALKINGLV